MLPKEENTSLSGVDVLWFVGWTPQSLLSATEPSPCPQGWEGTPAPHPRYVMSFKTEAASCWNKLLVASPKGSAKDVKLSLLWQSPPQEKRGCGISQAISRPLFTGDRPKE